jgi:rfaE bifunctional protein kinase chain/domain
MDTSRFQEIAAGFRNLRIAVIGDFCLDRYLEIDPGRSETSIETGLEVYNVVNVRSQPGGAGTILNNLLDLGVGRIIPIGFCGIDGEGAELRGALAGLGERVDLEHFVETGERRTFTYTKPLLIREGVPPQELNRLDFKNWSRTPNSLSETISNSLKRLAQSLDAIVVLDQVDVAGTGVVTDLVLETLAEIAKARPSMLILGDSRNGIGRFPAISLKVNDEEFRRQLSLADDQGDDSKPAVAVAKARGSNLFVTQGSKGILSASSEGESGHSPALPVRGAIDIVGAGDAVTANLAAVLAAGGSNQEAMETAMAAASVVIHKLGTTGTATPEEISELLAD